jgi:glycosyltransferase involved in cell wall biosynthesis
MMNFGQGRLVDELRMHFPMAKLCLPVLAEPRKIFDHSLSYPDEAVTALPPLGTTISAQLYYGAVRRILRRFAAECDVLFVRLPFQNPATLLKLGKPKILHVVSNPRSVIAASNDYRGLMKFVALRFAGHLERIMKRLVAEPNSRTVTHGQEMWDLLECREGRIVVSSALYEREMQPRSDCRLGDPPRLLFVGFLRPEKGVNTLLEAFEQVRRRRPLKLTIVGGSDRPGRAEERIRSQVTASKFAADIELRGNVTFGPTLFEMYRTHDMYLLPSLSEGTPRTLVEARAFGCPVIATRVGGIPSSIEDSVDGLLVAPGSVSELAVGIERILDENALRLKLIQNGISRSKSLSIEHFASLLAEEIRIVGDCRSDAIFQGLAS